MLALDLSLNNLWHFICVHQSHDIAMRNIPQCAVIVATLHQVVCELCKLLYRSNLFMLYVTPKTRLYISFYFYLLVIPVYFAWMCVGWGGGGGGGACGLVFVVAVHIHTVFVCLFSVKERL